MRNRHHARLEDDVLCRDYELMGPSVLGLQPRLLHAIGPIHVQIPGQNWPPEVHNAQVLNKWCTAKHQPK
jgi:hypothetical protein